MAFEIPSEMIAEAILAFDASLSQWGKDCVLVYPNTRSECPNCIINASDGRSAGIYNGSGPTSFPAGSVCPVCGGEGYVNEPRTRTVKMRLYEDPQHWVGHLPTNVPDGTIQTRCKLEFYSDLVSCERMRVSAEGYRERTYQLLGEPIDSYGIVQGRYILAYWKRA